jgi:hypothetical protein
VDDIFSAASFATFKLHAGVQNKYIKEEFLSQKGVSLSCTGRKCEDSLKKVHLNEIFIIISGFIRRTHLVPLNHTLTFFQLVVYAWAEPMGMRLPVN